MIVAAVLQGACSSPSIAAAQRPLDASRERGASAIYAAVLQRAWHNQTDAPLLQRETEPLQGCAGFLPKLTGEWADVAKDFQRQNARERTLPPALPTTIRYRLITRAEIQADDARLARKYPGGWQRRPESMEYWAVSAVGFNRDRTKSMVYVRSRMSGGVVRLEFKDGKWGDAAGETCGWIA
ncbi:MAG TPA: hypothetical protein VGI12_03525 [Vicinamibacterales bacterium]